jgi:hypothetical protein
MAKVPSCCAILDTSVSFELAQAIVATYPQQAAPIAMQTG